jgi:hypothetical protein
MSLLDTIFYTVSESATLRDISEEKHQYDFNMSPMQNSYLEILSRFNGNCPYPELKSMVKSYTACLKRDSYNKCNNLLPQIVKSNPRNVSIFPMRDFPGIFPIHKFPGKFPSHDHDLSSDINYRHLLAIKDLEHACPNYHTPGSDPETIQTCYSASLNYWQTVMDLYVENMNHYDSKSRAAKSLNKTTFDQTENSILLRKYYFNNPSFAYHKHGDIK